MRDNIKNVQTFSQCHYTCRKWMNAIVEYKRWCYSLYFSKLNDNNEGCLYVNIYFFFFFLSLFLNSTSYSSSCPVVALRALWRISACFLFWFILFLLHHINWLKCLIYLIISYIIILSQWYSVLSVVCIICYTVNSIQYLYHLMNIFSLILFDLQNSDFSWYV